MKKNQDTKGIVTGKEKIEIKFMNTAVITKIIKRKWEKNT